MKKIIPAILLLVLVALNSITTLAAEDSRPDYQIMVNRAANCITVYERGESGEFDVPVIAFVCSTGKNNATRTGSFATTSSYEWRLMNGGVYAQYATRFDGGRLLHSVPYYTRNAGNLEWQDYNRLGEQASAGCVRLACIDAKWIYDNCKPGTKVIVYDDAENPGPLGKPTGIQLSANDPNRGWDPTDPNPNNPWASIRPQLQLIANTPGNNILYLPAGSSMEMLQGSIGMFSAEGLPYAPGTYTIEVYGRYDLNTPGNYQIYVRGFDGHTNLRADQTITLSVTPGIVGVPAIASAEIAMPESPTEPDTAELISVTTCAGFVRAENVPTDIFPLPLVE